LFNTLGLPPRDHHEIRRKVVLAISTDKSIKGRAPIHNEAFGELGDLIASEVAIRRKHPSDDLITHLAEAEIDGDHLSDREVIMTTATFVMAGVESLSSFMSMLALNLHDFPDVCRRVAADPSLMLPAIEETLRYNTSAQRFKRTIAHETELHGQTLRAGDKVVLAYGSGNRDWRKFENPDAFDLDRRPREHLGFGTGTHYCLGHQMARLVSEAAMNRFLTQVLDFHLTVPAVAWNSSSNFRSPVALPFALE
jgi:hypothetical protein